MEPLPDEPDPIELRTIAPHDWPSWRALRLEALREAPEAFSSVLADWQGAGDTPERWQTRVCDVPFNVVAYLDGCAAGMVSGVEPDVEGSVDLISLWVAPFARGHGVGAALVRAVIAWARERGARSVWLAVRENNERAIALYRSLGFVDAGRASDHGEWACELAMTCPLSG